MDYRTDLDGHIHLLQMHLQIGRFPVPPLYYSLLYLMKQVFLSNYKINTAILLSGAVLWKFTVAHKYLRTQLRAYHKPEWVAMLVLFGLMFFFPVYLSGIDGSKLYLGKFTPTIWHNSTTIFAFPFSILLFISSIKYIDLPNRRHLAYLFLFGFLILMSKPSFLFAFVPVFPVMYLLRRKTQDKNLFNVTVLCFFLIAGIGLLKWSVYDKGEIDNLLYGREKTEIFIAPFEVWLNWTNTPIFDVASSFLFLVLFLWFYHERLWKDWHFQYALLLFFVALGIFWVFAESGERFAHGNFYWQIPICLFMVYLVLIKNWVQVVDIKASLADTIKGSSKQNLVLLGAFFFHVFSGGIYLCKLLYFGSFS